MKINTTLMAGACALATLATPAASQEEGAFRLPDQCSGTSLSGMEASGTNGSATEHGMGHDMSTGDHGMDMAADHGEGGAMPDHVRQNMERMMLTMPAMRQGMMQDDPDIAFACGMIAHHRAAIDMAQVVLDHGRDAEMRALATEIVAVQEREIEAMTRWLETAAD